MSDVFTGLWEFEAADPEVGFLTDSIRHECCDEPEEATQEHSMSTVKRNGEEVVAETVKFTCPSCGATTSHTEHWPLWMFEAPGPEADDE